MDERDEQNRQTVEQRRRQHERKQLTAAAKTNFADASEHVHHRRANDAPCERQIKRHAVQKHDRFGRIRPPAHLQARRIHRQHQRGNEQKHQIAHAAQIFRVHEKFRDGIGEADEKPLLRGTAPLDVPRMVKARAK
ncbi:MAG: hypothetical protein DCC52_06415 [Chloroflexi bacterium]|nr:MAG: hypothetical protein DCC52_06415 [Chloroflexota bacterium]